MNRKLLAAGAVVAVLVAAGAIWWFGSTDIDDPIELVAPTLPAETTTPTAAPDSTTAETAPEDSSISGSLTYELVEGSVVSFEIDEELRGSPFRVVATNPEVAGQLRVDPADLTLTEVGTIVVGAQTFTTDSGNRDRAIRGPILDSEVFPTIEFVPTSIDGLSGALEPGAALQFTLTGDLTVRDVTAPVSFTVTASGTDQGTIEGSAEAIVSREAYGLEIPSVPLVANVADEVLIRIDFVAEPIG